VGQLETVWASELSAADGKAFDGFVALARGGHYSQTRPWATLATASKPFTPFYFLARREGCVLGAALILRTQLRRVLTLPSPRSNAAQPQQSGTPAGSPRGSPRSCPMPRHFTPAHHALLDLRDAAPRETTTQAARICRPAVFRRQLGALPQARPCVPAGTRTLCW
jgi:hypothetical protein